MESVIADKTVSYAGNDKISVEQYYQHVIGVTVSSNLRKQNIRIFVNRENAPYVETKPLHPSQEVIERRQDGIIIGIQVQLNYELEKEIMGFGEGMVVLQPERLRKRMQAKLSQAIMNYDQCIE
jgi:predicted DNA-binding transcriptional regulator YafY